MHEMSICQSLLNLLEEQAKSRDFATVKRVSLEIGPFAGIEIEALKFGFDVVMRGSLAEGAKLDIVETQARATCLNCGSAVELAERFDPCPNCGSHRLKVTAGEEMRIRELEVN